MCSNMDHLEIHIGTHFAALLNSTGVECIKCNNGIQPNRSQQDGRVGNIYYQDM